MNQQRVDTFISRHTSTTTDVSLYHSLHAEVARDLTYWVVTKKVAIRCAQETQQPLVLICCVEAKSLAIDNPVTTVLKSYSVITEGHSREHTQAVSHCTTFL